MLAILLHFEGTYGKDGVPAARFDRTVDKSQPLYSSPTKLGIMDAEGQFRGPKNNTRYFSDLYYT